MTEHLSRDILRLLLQQEVRVRSQDPKLERHGDRWRIRPWVPYVTTTGEVARRQESIPLGKVGETTRTQAIDRKREVLAALGAGPVTMQANIKFSDLAERYRELGIPLLAASTRAKYVGHLERHILPAFGKLRLVEIDRLTVETWLSAKTKLSHATRLDLRNILAAVFSWAHSRRLWGGENPAHGAEVGRGGTVREKRYMSPEQIRRFLAEIRDTAVIPARQARLVASVAIVGGLRVSEILGLRREDLGADHIDIRRAWVRGAVDETKTKASARRVFLGELVDELRRLPALGYLFGIEGGDPPDDRDLQQHVWRPAAERAGIYHSGLGLHTLRRLHITWSQDEGAGALETMLRAGHTRVSTTTLYTMPDPRRGRALAETLLSRIDPARPPKTIEEDKALKTKA